MIKIESCPICGSSIKDAQLNVDEDILRFLEKLRKDGTLNDYLRVVRKYIDIMRETAPMATILTTAMGKVKEDFKDIASTEFNAVLKELPVMFEDILNGKVFENVLNCKIPEKEQLSKLSENLTDIMKLLYELKRKDEVSAIKGKLAEQEIADELCSYFPEDDVEPLGGSGETDIVLKPRFNGISSDNEVMIESKMTKVWKQSYLDGVKTHMVNRNCRYAILTVETMPKGANGYMTKMVEEGTIYVSSRENIVMVYGALRSVLLSEFSLGKRMQNLHIVLEDVRIQEAIALALKSMEPFNEIRRKANSIKTNADFIVKESNSLEQAISGYLVELQQRVQSAIQLMPQQIYLDTKISR